MALNSDHWRLDGIVILFLFLLNLLLFGETLSHPFMMDDQQILTKNVQPLSLSSIADSFNPAQRSEVFYRPVSDIFRLVIYHLTGGDAAGYRLINIILFTFLLGVIYLFTRRIFQDRYFALVSVALFAVHPINGFYVNYITCHEVLLVGLLLFLSLNFHVSFLRTNRSGWLVGSIVAYLLALGMQEMSASFPVYIFLVAMYVTKSWVQGIKKGLVYFWVTVIWIVVHKMSSTGVDISGMIAQGISLMGLNPANYLPSLLHLVSWYLSQLILPAQVLFMKSFWPVENFGWYFNVVAVLIVVAVCWTIKTLRPLQLKWALLWFVVGFIPLSVASLVYPAEGMVIEPHWFLVSSCGFFWSAAYLILAWQKCINRPIGAAVVIGVVLMLTCYTKMYNQLWRSQRSYCAYWISLQPDHQLPNFWLGMDYLKNGKLSSAEYFFKRSLTGWYIDWEVFINLGVIALRQGQWDQADIWNRKALSINPGSSEAYNNLGLAALKRGNPDQARDFFLKSSQLDPGNRQANENLLQLNAER